MCEMTSIGEMSAARTTIPDGRAWASDGLPSGVLRTALTTSLTPRFRHFCLAAMCLSVIEAMRILAKSSAYPS